MQRQEGERAAPEFASIGVPIDIDLSTSRCTQVTLAGNMRDEAIQADPSGRLNDSAIVKFDHAAGLGKSFISLGDAGGSSAKLLACGEDGMSGQVYVLQNDRQTGRQQFVPFEAGASPASLNDENAILDVPQDNKLNPPPGYVHPEPTIIALRRNPTPVDQNNFARFEARYELQAAPTGETGKRRHVIITWQGTFRGDALLGAH